MAFTVFGKREPGAILVTNSLMVRNNCQMGAWTNSAQEPYGSGPVKIAVLCYQQKYGTIGQSTTKWGLIWFVCEEGCLPRDVVLGTYIKTRSLASFEETVVTTMAQGYEPALGLLVAKFIKHSGVKNGNPTTYYSLSWSWEPRPEGQATDDRITLLADAASHTFVDSNTNLVDLSNLSAEELRLIMSSARPTELPFTED